MGVDHQGGCVGTIAQVDEAVCALAKADGEEVSFRSPAVVRRGCSVCRHYYSDRPIWRILPIKTCLGHRFFQFFQ